MHCLTTAELQFWTNAAPVETDPDTTNCTDTCLTDSRWADTGQNESQSVWSTSDVTHFDSLHTYHTMCSHVGLMQFINCAEVTQTTNGPTHEKRKHTHHPVAGSLDQLSSSVTVGNPMALCPLATCILILPVYKHTHTRICKDAHANHHTHTVETGTYSIPHIYTRSSQYPQR